MKKILIAILLGASLISGCAAKGAKSYPNAINAFDSTAFDTLVTAQAAIEAAKADITAHPEAKDVLNKAIAAYNSAEAAYSIYHSLGDPAQQAEMQKQLSDLIASVGQVEKSFGRKP